MQRLAVFIIAKDEADRIARCIQSVLPLTDEVIVIDSGSTDGTQEIAASFGAKVIFNTWNGYGSQKIFGERQCSYNWVLNLDADEFLDAKCCEAIQSALEDPKDTAFRMRLSSLYPLENKISRFAPREKIIRLYDKTKAGYADSPVHDRVTVHQGSVGDIWASFYHQSMRSLSHWVAKNDAYASALAKDAFHKGRKASAMKVLSAYPLGFLKAFILRRFCVYGINGFIYAHLFAHFRLMKSAKLKELHQSAQR